MKKEAGNFGIILDHTWRRSTADGYGTIGDFKKITVCPEHETMPIM